MKGLLAWLGRRCARRRGVLRFVDVNLRGIGQVMFQDNPAQPGCCSSSRSAGARTPPACRRSRSAGCVAVVAATLTAQWLRVDAATLRAGLYGYNAYLVGLALATFLAPGPLLWVYVVLGGAVSVVATLGHRQRVQDLGRGRADRARSCSSRWLLLLATYGFAGLDGRRAAVGAA